MIASTVTQFSCMGGSTFAKEVGRTAGLYTLRALTFKTLLQISELSAFRFVNGRRSLLGLLFVYGRVKSIFLLDAMRGAHH
jgi:hypothetical protein